MAAERRAVGGQDYSLDSAASSAVRLSMTVAIRSRPYSAGLPARLHQNTWNPAAAAPCASHALLDTKPVRAGGIPSACSDRA